MPINRGILATVYVRGDPGDFTRTLAAAYADEPFLQVLPFGALPSTRDIAGSNFCHLGVIGDRMAGRAVVVVGLDNLNKGSSGQAIQNANLMLGIEETAGPDAGPGLPVRGRHGRMKSLKKTRRVQIMVVAALALALAPGLFGYAMRDGINFFRSPIEVRQRSANARRGLPHRRPGRNRHAGTRSGRRRHLLRHR